jgi:hypothetical protein
MALSLRLVVVVRGASQMENPSVMNFGITSGSMTLTLSPDAATIQVGSVSATFNLFSALATLKGTISGTYTATILGESTVWN